MRMDKAKALIREQLLRAGAVAAGFTPVAEVPVHVRQEYDSWLASGRAGALGYMRNYPDIRFNPSLLMPEARTIICVAWPYLPSRLRPADRPVIARYAYAPDYHKSLRRILKPMVSGWQRDFSLSARICIDSAPILERYWAVQAGIGFLGRNGTLIVPGYGSWVFLTEILVSLPLPPDAPCTLTCDGCGLCVQACPTGALCPDSHVDCRRCLSALTLEAPGNAPQGFNTLAGCDRCQEVCPHNREAVPHNIPALETLPAILTLDTDETAGMTDEEFRTRFAGSALLRPGRQGLLANIAKL